MRIAIQDPHWIHLTDSHQTHDYGVEFLRLFKPLIYLSRVDSRGQLERFLQSKHLDPDTFEVIYAVPSLNRQADVLICLNGFPHVPPHEPARQFTGLKIYHVMDYMTDSSRIRDALLAGRVDYVMGYAAHDRHDPFFRAVFPTFAGRVIGVPFGFHPRLSVTVPFAARKDKCLAIGALVPVRDPRAAASQQQDLVSFHSDEPWRHRFARTLTEHAAELQDVVDLKFAAHPETSSDTDPDGLLDSYRLFVPTESLFHFPPPAVFAGTATGAVMICSDHPCFRDLGFIGGVNCITHRELDFADFRTLLESYRADPEHLYAIHAEGTRFVRERYSHQAVARALQADIKAIWTGRSFPHDGENLLSAHISALSAVGG